MQCPRCQSTKLVQALYENVQIDKCQQCHGVWLDEDEILTIISTKEKKFSQELIKKTIAESFNGIPKVELKNRIKCPHCAQLMNPVNYAVSSGIIIDRCPNDHGLWFDHQELEKVQAYREYWSDETDKHRDGFLELMHEQETFRSTQTKNNKHSMLFTLAKIFSRLP